VAQALLKAPLHMRAFALIVLFLVACATTGAAKPKQGEPCDANGKCSQRLTCVRYYGVAGARGPQFTSCEIKCGEGIKGRCPKGQACITIADGPGQVCRPEAKKPNP
jgi:hypothetical protein